jgi:pimeloyl-ACP methyl ester carboxylesterase
VVADEVPETQFAWSGEDRVAFQVFGEGDIDVLFTSASPDTMELRWDWPPYADFLRRLGTRARVVMFDRRGMGSSERASGEPLPGWEQWADDARAVLDLVGSQQAVLLGTGHGGPIALCSQPVIPIARAG